ncbi:KH domain-containing protein [Peptoniphilus lacrimalis]|uniref:KH domain-containing protein n=1 Tax=Peptoniphilus lacrimalis TaxID=33031 RepID=UPI0023F94D86|nr:KH domain-containing protein [Peptoniphilus lacrimalis]
MVELIEYIAKSLVDEPEKVKVSSQEGEDVNNILLQVSSTDMGKVIGKQGRIAKAIRSILKAVSLKEEIRVNLEIDEIQE